MIKLLFFLSCISLGAMATTFRAQPIENQIQEASGLFQGNYLKKKTIQLEDGRLATQMFFKMNQEAGLQSDFYGMDEVIVHYPGGSLNDKHVRVDGVPEFVPGEKVLIFIRNIENRYWGLNLGYGAFRVINYGKDVMLVNYIFPNHPQVGQVSFEHFEQLVKDIKGVNLTVVHALEQPGQTETETVQRMPASEGQNRAIASKPEALENEEARPNVHVFWLIAFLGLAGGLFRLNNRKTHK